MKNLRSILAKTLIVLYVLAIFASCKKDKTEPEENAIDITQHVIVGKKTEMGDFGRPILPFVITFDTDGNCKLHSLAGKTTGTFIYANGNLKITLNYGIGPAIIEFKLESNRIISNSSKDPGYQCELLETPETNQLSTSTYDGTWKPYSGALGKSAIFKVTDNQYGEAEFNTPVTNKPYTLIKNIAAESISNGVLSFWVLVNGRLEGSRFDVNTTKFWSTGTFTKP